MPTVSDSLSQLRKITGRLWLAPANQSKVRSEQSAQQAGSVAAGVLWQVNAPTLIFRMI
jgi:hypothetical protein